MLTLMYTLYLCVVNTAMTTVKRAVMISDGHTAGLPMEGSGWRVLTEVGGQYECGLVYIKKMPLM